MLSGGVYHEYFITRKLATEISLNSDREVFPFVDGPSDCLQTGMLRMNSHRSREKQKLPGRGKGRREEVTAPYATDAIDVNPMSERNPGRGPQSAKAQVLLSGLPRALVRLSRLPIVPLRLVRGHTRFDRWSALARPGGVVLFRAEEFFSLV